MDGAQLSELSITLPGDEIRMFREHAASIWHSADKSSASTCVCGRRVLGICLSGFVFVCKHIGLRACVCLCM